MRKFVTDLVLLLQAGEIEAESVLWADAAIPIHENHYCTFWLLKLVGKSGVYGRLGYIVQGMFRYTLVDSRQRVKLTMEETRAVKAACENKLTTIGTPWLEDNLSEMVDAYQARILSEGKHLR